LELGLFTAIDSNGRTIWIADAHRDDGRRFIVHADEKLSAFVELERQVLTVTFYRINSCRFAPSNLMTRSRLPVQSRTLTSPERKQARFCK
jgi:hypothetical protein